MKGLNGRRTDRALRMMVPTIGYPIGLFVLIARASQGVAKATARQFAWHGIGSGTVMSVLPKRNRLRETRKRAQPTGCPLSHWCPKKLGSSYGVSQLIFKLREVSSHEN